MKERFIHDIRNKIVVSKGMSMTMVSPNKRIAKLDRDIELLDRYIMGDKFGIIWLISNLSLFSIWGFVYPYLVDLWFVTFYLLGFGIFFSLGYHYERQKQIGKKLIKNL